MRTPSKILIAETEENIRESIEIILFDEGYACKTIAQSDSLAKSTLSYKPDLIIIDIDLLYDHVQELLKTLNQYSLSPSILVTLSYERVSDMLYLMKFNVTEYIIKPFQFDDMLDRINKMIRLNAKNYQN